MYRGVLITGGARLREPRTQNPGESVGNCSNDACALIMSFRWLAHPRGKLMLVAIDTTVTPPTHWLGLTRPGCLEMPSKKRKAKSKKRKKQRADNGDSSPVTTTTKSTRAELEGMLLVFRCWNLSIISHICKLVFCANSGFYLTSIILGTNLRYHQFDTSFAQRF